MLKINGSAFYKALSWLRSIQTAVDHGEASKIPDTKIAIEEDEDAKNLTADLIKDSKALQGELRALGAKVTEMTVIDFIKVLESGEITFRDLGRYAEQIDATIKRELSLVSLFTLDQAQVKLFEGDPPLFGKTVADKFPSVVFEVGEVGKCLAIKRATAAVFHLMRITEIGINAVRQSLAIPDPIRGGDRNWGAILRLIKAEMVRRSDAKLWKNNDKEFFESAYACLDAIKGAWRNTTMHVENKYNDEEAEDILAAVRAFMRTLSGRLDEQGVPIA